MFKQRTKSDKAINSIFFETCKLDFRKGVRQHTECVVGSIILILLAIYISLSSERILKIR